MIDSNKTEYNNRKSDNNGRYNYERRIKQEKEENDKFGVRGIFTNKEWVELDRQFVERYIRESQKGFKDFEQR